MFICIPISEAESRFDLVGIPPAPRGVPQIEAGATSMLSGLRNKSLSPNNKHPQAPNNEYGPRYVDALIFGVFIIRDWGVLIVGEGIAHSLAYKPTYTWGNP